MAASAWDGPASSQTTGSRSRRSEQLVRGYRQIVDALAGRVVDGVGNRGRHSDDADLAQPLGAERVDELVLFGDEDHFEVVHVGVHRDVVVREAVSHKAAKLAVEHALLLERHPNAADQAADDLAAGGLWVENPATCDGA